MIKTMLRLYITIILTLAGTAVSSQTDNNYMEFPKIRLGFTPSAIANSHPALQLSFDRRISKSVNFSLESAFIFTSLENAKGFRLRPGLETFIARSSWVSLTGGIHLNYRHSIDYIDQDIRSSEGDFVRWNYNVRRSVGRLGFNISENLLFKIGKKSYAELGSGLGVTSELLNLGPSQADVQEVTILSNLGQRVGLFSYFYTHLNFSYRLGK